MNVLKNIEKLLGGCWIAPEEDFGNGVIYFETPVAITAPLTSAKLYVSGIGYHHVRLNGKDISGRDGTRLFPAISSYHKRCYYQILDLTGDLSEGGNTLTVMVAQGWRRNYGGYLDGVLKTREIEFFGIPQLTAALVLEYADGSVSTIVTDDTWDCKRGNITESHLFDGETYDARIPAEGVRVCSAKKVPAPSEDTIMCLQELEPIRIKNYYTPVSVHEAGSGYVFDLGQNIAGLCELTIPEGLPEGRGITISHAELLDEEGDLFTAALRSAKATDRYIAGKENAKTYMPTFVYHGFRFVKVTGLDKMPDRSILRGVQFYTDIDSGSSFRCGNALVNEIQRMVVITERDNLHSIATDCPQRDERMGWLNDASVRFEELPYNFDARKLFPKIVRDIIDTQIDGAFSCTAPYVYGNRPADPVSSSFLIAAYMNYMHYGDTSLIKEAYPNFCAWNEHLTRYCKDGILEKSYYGDWAGPQDCCLNTLGGCFANSDVTPGIYMSTGYHFYNYILLARFAEILGLDADREKHLRGAEYVRQAMLKKWLAEDGTLGTGSQACYALALRLGILPEELRADAAKRMNRAVVDAGMRITTGNLCTLYLHEMLSEYGYIDTAWELITREEYPSIGHMIANGATTVWERFELKKDPSMNSHCHPMYGSIGKWFYSHIAGITPLEAGYEKVKIAPYIPTKLLTAQANVTTVRGDVSVRWEKSYGELKLLTSIPKNTSATVIFDGETHEVGAGTHVFRTNIK